jgi:hypothetical protein
MRVSDGSVGQRVRTHIAGVLTLTLLLGVGPLPARAACVGDCDANGTVTVDELVKMVNIALGTAPVGSCSAGDQNGDADVTIDEIIAAVSRLQNGCASAETPTPTETLMATKAPTATPIPQRVRRRIHRRRPRPTRRRIPQRAPRRRRRRLRHRPRRLIPRRRRRRIPRCRPSRRMAVSGRFTSLMPTRVRHSSCWTPMIRSCRPGRPTQTEVSSSAMWPSGQATP